MPSYNQDFVERNLQLQLPGIFTLGTDDASLLKQIEATKQKCDEIEQQIKQLRHSLNGSDGNGGKQAELSSLFSDYDTYFWTFKTRYDAQFQEAFRGVRNSKAAFRSKILEEASANRAKLCSVDDLGKRAETVFAAAPAKQASIPEIEFSTIEQ